MKRLMIGAATAIALLAGPAFAASSGSGADSPAATSTGANDTKKNPPCVPGSNDLACGNATSGSARGDWSSSGSGGSGSSSTGSGSLGSPDVGAVRTAPGVGDTPRSTSGSGSNSGRGTAR